jgi:hypothetical protein
MQWNRKEWFISACGGVLIAVACAGLSGFGQDWAGMLFLPGALLAALIFPEGIHGDSPTLYMIAAFVLTTAIVTLILAFGQLWWIRRKAQSSNQ